MYLFNPHNYSIWDFPNFLFKRLRKNNFITDDNEIICSVKDFNDYRKYLHRRKLEAENKNGDEQDELQLKLSKLLYDKVQKNQTKTQKFAEKYRKDVGNDFAEQSSNPLRFKKVVELMQHKKLEQEKQRMEK